VAQAASPKLTGGTWIVTGTGAGAGKLVLPGGNFTENDGSVALSGQGSFPQIDALAKNVGSFSLVGGANFTTTGNLQSPGSITVGPGSALSVTGTMTLASTSAVTVEIGGPSTSQYGQVNATGADTLAGTLNIVVVNSFEPTTAQQFQIMNFSGAGGTQFGTVNGLTAGQFTVFTLAENPTNIILNATTTYASVPPEITNVLVDGSSWSASFVAGLQAAGEGNGIAYSIPSAAAQSKPLPWTNINQITIDFSKDVSVQQASLALTGVNTASYSFSAFSYNPITYSATWTLSSAIGADKLQVSVPSSGPNAVTDRASNALDGEWANGSSSFPSGNGTAGGDFNFNFNVLPGDVNQSGIVNAQDIAAIASHWLQANQFADDTNGDGIVNAQDLAAIASHWLGTLPAGGPAASAAAGIVGSGQAADMGLSAPTLASQAATAMGAMAATASTPNFTAPQSADRLAAFVGPSLPALNSTTVDRVMQTQAGPKDARSQPLGGTSNVVGKTVAADVEDLAPAVDDNLVSLLAASRSGVLVLGI
jgi:Dockerin type I domain